MKMQVVMKAGDIPLYSRVTKKTGEKPYELRDHITFFKAPGDGHIPQRVEGNGVRFMVDERGTIECVTCDKELMWHVREEDLKNWLIEREMERESK